MASTPTIVPLWLLGQLVLPCQGISLDLVAGRGSEGRDVPESWFEPVSLDEADRSDPDDGCLDAEVGDSCYELVTWCLEHGLQERPEWFTAFSPTASWSRDFRQMQGILHGKGKGRCGRPCSSLVQQMQRAQDRHQGGVQTTPPAQHPRRVWVKTTSPTPPLEAPSAEGQGAPKAEVQEAPEVRVQEVPNAEVHGAPEVEAPPEAHKQEAE